MKLESIKKIGVAGGGTMGSGIALIFAQKGYEVVVTDISDKFLENTKKIISINNRTLINEGLLSEEEAQESLKYITYSTNKKVFADADLIIEAIVEKMDIKQDYWKEVEEIAREDAIFATNTSGLSINGICEKVKNKGRFIGMHWWNPPHIIPLIELIKADDTTDDTVNILKQLVDNIGKKSVVVLKDANGFIGNRIQFAVYREALKIVEDGIATVEDVDNAMKYGPGFRYPVLGPFETADLGGLDTFYFISSYLFNELSCVKEPTQLQRELMDNKDLGVKSGKGFYDYPDKKGEEVMQRRDENFFKMLKYIHKEKNRN
ncbi:3-hydroxybutyryl-CoA dehydrogenase [Sedimentibacter acidaminivorans]|uniref:3-hydroxybutyryl-CoA dehydrogenase n=1 Tax=Sedimentibacter acidaminivorans TaxID=913099 RepID=A0ABS4GD20_9FIRM|nr:3-hydroxyacyl-CoA dehydrogenase family protein [Sedimentibacter acidaminivorans]MBP1925595.1 3-hydroxybutyryl-CoA dehydrogenase [Sedimentibacter acidaminivorans]